MLWITTGCWSREKPIETLGDLVWVAKEVGRVSLLQLGRMLAEERPAAAQDALQPAGWFTSNGGLTTSGVRQEPLRCLFGSRKQRKNHPVVVSLDWAEVRSFDTLMVAPVCRRSRLSRAARGRTATQSRPTAVFETSSWRGRDSRTYLSAGVWHAVPFRLQSSL